MELTYRQWLPIVFLVIITKWLVYESLFSMPQTIVPEGNIPSAIVLNLGNIHFQPEIAANEVTPETHKITEASLFDSAEVKTTRNHKKILETKPTPTSSNQASTSKQKEGLSGDSLQLPNYKQQVLMHLNRYKKYPPHALRRGIEGTILLQLTISKDGTLLNYQIIQSSGHLLLDQAVEAMVKRVQQFPAHSFANSSITLEFPIIFQVG